MPKMQNKTGVKTVKEKPIYVATAYMGKIYTTQCIGRLCRIVNGRLVTIAYLFI